MVCKFVVLAFRFAKHSLWLLCRRVVEVDKWFVDN